jgi:hypothetical protein
MTVFQSYNVLATITACGSSSSRSMWQQQQNMHIHGEAACSPAVESVAPAQCIRAHATGQHAKHTMCLAFARVWKRGPIPP